jgi:hypothetical protein
MLFPELREGRRRVGHQAMNEDHGGLASRLDRRRASASLERKKRLRIESVDARVDRGVGAADGRRHVVRLAVAAQHADRLQHHVAEEAALLRLLRGRRLRGEHGLRRLLRDDEHGPSATSSDSRSPGSTWRTLSLRAVGRRLEHAREIDVGRRSAGAVVGAAVVALVS